MRLPLLLKRVAASVCCLAAIYSFTNTSLYSSVEHSLTSILESMNFPLLLGLELGTFLRFVLIVALGLATINLVTSDTENSHQSILFFCILLYLPEALSLSEINYFNAVHISALLTSTRSPWAILITGLVIMFGYMVVIVASDSVRYSETYVIKGAEKADVYAASSGQARFTLLLTTISVITLLGVTITSSLISSALNGIMANFEFRHIVYGIAAILMILLGLGLYNRSRS